MLDPQLWTCGFAHAVHHTADALDVSLKHCTSGGHSDHIARTGIDAQLLATPKAMPLCAAQEPGFVPRSGHHE